MAPLSIIVLDQSRHLGPAPTLPLGRTLGGRFRCCTRRLTWVPSS